MVSFDFLKIRITISYFFLSMLAILILSDRSGSLSNSLLAVVFHEVGHLLMMKLLKIKVNSVNFTLSTVGINTDGIISVKYSLLVATAGPAVNLIMSCFLLCKTEILIYFGAANLILFLFNMFPVKGLDGGDLLYYLLHILKFKSADKIYSVISILSIAALILLGGLLFFMSKSNITLLLVGIYLFILSFYKI